MIATGLAFGAVNAHMSGLAAVRQAREASASQTLAHQLRQAIDSVHRWADIAKKHAAENEKLKIEIERLKRVARDQHADLVALARTSK